MSKSSVAVMGWAWLVPSTLVKGIPKGVIANVWERESMRNSAAGQSGLYIEKDCGVMGKSVVMVNNRCGIDNNNEGGREGLEAHKSMVS